MKKLDLTDNWKLHEAPIDYDEKKLEHMMSVTDGWMCCSLPCDVKMPLIENHIIKDPVLSDYSYSSEWVSERSWWFVKSFMSQDIEISDGAVELCIESIDACGEVFLNGEKIGEQHNAFFPFVKDIKNYIVEGSNTLCVRVTTGLEKVSEEQIHEIHGAVCTETTNGRNDRGDLRRTYVRRPQYNVGWDWCPKSPSCGIVKGASITCFDKNTIRNVNVSTVIASENSELSVLIEIERFDPFSTADAGVQIEITLNGERSALVEKDVFLTSGLNIIRQNIIIHKAKLWWPTGYGEQPLYDINVSLNIDGKKEDYPVVSYGIRTVEIDTSRINEKQRHFDFIINGIKIFCKGGNWIPADPIYARISDEKRISLLEKAQKANFNMLRVWGGGYYETDAFYSFCDKNGILIWQDYMLACGAFPDHIESFEINVAREAEYQTKRLGNHPSICLWCGNNEVHSYLYAIGVHEQYPDKQYGLFLSNTLLKRITFINCPFTPYWNGSPYGGDNPDCENVGDVHYWGNCMMNRRIEKRVSPFEYDNIDSGFISEYGYVGPCTLKTIQVYFGEDNITQDSSIWEHHNNTFEKKTVAAGIAKHYGDTVPSGDINQYILKAGMVQSLMLEYSLEAIRSKINCGGALFWMFNDTWGEVGWSIVDYSLREKISFYGVKRALSHQKLILRRDGNLLSIIGCNDSSDRICTTVKIGKMSLNGKHKDLIPYKVELQEHSRCEVLRIDMPEYNKQKEIIAVIPENGIEPERLYEIEFQKMDIEDCEIEIKTKHINDRSFELLLKAKGFVHGFCLPEYCNPSDNYFELLPGTEKSVEICSRANKIAIETIYPGKKVEILLNNA